MQYSDLRPILMFTGNYKNEPSLNREGVNNCLFLMKQAFFTSAGLNLDENDSCIIDNKDYIEAWEMLSKFVSTTSQDSVILFYFCGHGFPNYANHTVVLGTHDITKSNTKVCGIKHTDLVELFRQFGIRNYIIVLDCCQGGFMCSMGDSDADQVFELNKSDQNTSSVVYISSTMQEEYTIQKQYDGKFFLPFTYYFANFIIERSKNHSAKFSIGSIYNFIISKLKSEGDYPAKCVYQTKGDSLWEEAIFKGFTNKVIGESSGFRFGSHFNITQLRVLLVKTAIKHPISKYDDFGVPLGLWLLKGHLFTQGLSLVVDIYDERLEIRKSGGGSEEKERIKGQFAELVANYDVIGISMCTSEVFPAMEKFRIAKQAGKVTFCGGIFTTSNERYLIESGLVDYVIPGVSTVPTTKLLAKLIQDKKQGNLGKHIITEYYIASKNNIDQFGNPWEPSILPPMRLALWEEIIQQYGDYLIDEKTNKRRMDVYTSRGCSRNCSFCSVQKESRQHQFRKDTECIIEEIQYLKEKGIKYFSIKDENFISNPESISSILEIVAEDGVKFKIRARFDEMQALNIPLQKLQQLGVDEIQYGIESPDIYLSRTIHKGFPGDAKRSDLVSFIRNHAEYGITANCSFILGIAGEDEAYYDSLYDFITQIYNETSRPKIYINFLTPHPMNSSFPTQNYSLSTNNLNYFTHKFPVCYAQSSTYGIRKKMLETYEKIVEYTNSAAYNPLDIPEKLKRTFLSGNANISSNSIPMYTGNED